jgi:hypothetical protein
MPVNPERPSEPGDESPPTSPTGDHPADADALFATFVRHRDVHCPRCDYSLRNALHPTCPECGEPLRLTVGVVQPIMGALLATIVPGLGCGICAVIFATLMTMHPGAPPPIIVATVLMLISGVASLIILARRRAFLRQSRDRQRIWAIVSIVIHSILFLFLLVSFD